MRMPPNPAHARSALRDLGTEVTAEQRASAAALSDDARLRALPDNALAVILLLDDGRFVDADPAALARLRDCCARKEGLPRQLQDPRRSERGRLAREIHDELGRLLATLDLHLRHASARPVRIWLSEGQDALRMVIRDDGVGFDVAQARAGRDAGFGIVGMAERIQRLGGHLRIYSTPGRGSTLRVLVPLRSHPAPGAA